MLKLSILITVDLEAVVGEMHELVVIREAEFARARPQIALLVHVNAKVICHEGPDAYIELSLIEEKGLLQVFLDDPLLDLPVLGNVILNLSQAPHKGDTPSPVHPSWFHDPDVRRAMLGRHGFIHEVTPADILELLLQLGELIRA